VTESLTKEERIQLSTRWPPDTKLYLKLLRVHDEQVEMIDSLTLTPHAKSILESSGYVVEDNQ
jgi:hypothetical protein